MLRQSVNISLNRAWSKRQRRDLDYVYEQTWKSGDKLSQPFNWKGLTDIGIQILLGQKSTHLDEVHHVFKCSYIVGTRITSCHFWKDIYIRPASNSGHHKTHNGSYVSLGKVPQSLLSRVTELRSWHQGKFDTKREFLLPGTVPQLSTLRLSTWHNCKWPNLSGLPLRICIL